MIEQAGTDGAVTALSRAVGVSRQTLYAWAARGRAALEAAFAAAPPAPVVPPALARAVLTLLVEGHASYRGLQRCLQALGYGPVSLGTIAAIVGTAQQRARA
jgi:transposase-like protein